MDIKVIKNFQKDRCEPINDEYILAFSKDGSLSLKGFPADKIYILNPETSREREVAPDRDKFFNDNVIYASNQRDYLIFSTAEKKEDKIILKYYLYRLEDDSEGFLYEIAMDAESFGFTEKVKVFVLDEFNLLFQTERNGEFELNLYSADTGKITGIDTPRLVEKGIHAMYPIADNKCVVHVGTPVLAENIRPGDPESLTGECIGIVPVNQMISELSINMGDDFIRIIEECREGTTIPYVRLDGHRLVYALHYIEDNKEDIIIFDTETKSKTIRINSRAVNITELQNTFVSDGTPYVVVGTDKKTKKIIDLNTQKTVITLESGDDVVFVYEDIAILTREKKKLFGQPADCVEAYIFPEIYTDQVMSTKGEYIDCLVNGEDLIIFTN